MAGPATLPEPMTTATAAPAGLSTMFEKIVVVLDIWWMKSSRVPVVAVEPPAVSRPGTASEPRALALLVPFKSRPPLWRSSRSLAAEKETVVPPATLRLLAVLVPGSSVALPVKRTLLPASTVAGVVA